MNTHREIVSLADKKIEEAERMCANGDYSAAYYYAGYAVELYLKARICITLDIDDFYDFGNRPKLINEDTIMRSYKVHNFEQLLILSGLNKIHRQEMKSVSFDAAWNILIEWKEDVRYTTGIEKQKAIKFINSVKTFATWIKRHL